MSPFTETGGVSSVLNKNYVVLINESLIQYDVLRKNYPLLCQLYNAVLNINQRRQRYSANIM